MNRKIENSVLYFPRDSISYSTSVDVFNKVWHSPYVLFEPTNNLDIKFTESIKFDVGLIFKEMIDNFNE